MGPNARTLLGRCGAPATFGELGPEQLTFAATREIDLGFARVRAARMSYVGGPGFELYVPVEMARHVWLALHEASEGLGEGDAGLVDAGYYALDALRIEAGRRAWGAELGPDETPFEAGAMFAVRLDKPDGFIGREALTRARGEPLRKKLVTIIVSDKNAYAWGGETVRVEGQAAGETASMGWSDAAGACVGFAYLRGVAAAEACSGRAVTIDLWGEEVAARAWDHWKPGVV
ncbi:MAG: glycine cleavage T C-terminal barrel domain-containing protein, partial [Caldimonas sp.]